MDQHSRANHAWVRSPVVSTCCPGRLGPGSQGPSVRPAFLGDSRPSSRTHRVDQLSQVTWAGSRGSAGRPAVPGDSDLCPRARRFNQMSQVTLARVRGPEGLTSSPGPFALLSYGVRCRPAVPGDGPCPSALRVDQLTEGVSGPCPRARGVDLMPRVTRARVRRLTVSTSCPGRIALCSDGPQC